MNHMLSLPASIRHWKQLVQPLNASLIQGERDASSKKVMPNTAL